MRRGLPNVRDGPGFFALDRGLLVHCPFCGVDNDRVIDSRAADAGKVIRRRRECLACHKRFTTYERVEVTHRLMVVKRDGSRQPFTRENILRGIQSACGKRPIPEEVKERLVDAVEEDIHRAHDREVTSSAIGERVMARLREIDEVAWVRFASEYYQFKSVEELRQQLRLLDDRVKDVKDQQKLF
ncbi:MAG: transcriptional repressor NrdR [Phycisphaerae bacterium]|nr:MAG: transcriptional repressor NrdR [Phycisphaerae bacterium]